jgi:hypothetical protein
MAGSQGTKRGRTPQDLAGERYGRWVVICRATRDRCWVCHCDCGTVGEVYAGNLTQGLSQSCGCLKREVSSRTLAALRATQRPPNVRDLTGMRFGRLTALRPADLPRRWVCECDCGTITTVFTGNLTRLHSTSCGCRKREELSERQRRHGLSKTKEHGSWCEIKRRCYDSSRPSFADYGAKGIRMCLGWVESFISFLADVGPAPSRAHTIDRRDNAGHYSCGHCEECRANGWPANCRWATRLQQGRNTGRSRWVEYRGEVKCLSEWVEILGIPRHVAWNRIAIKHMSPEEAFNTPWGPKLYAFGGQALTLKEWSRRTGIGYQTLVFRLKHGWTFEQAVTVTPKLGQKVRKVPGEGPG